MTYTEEGDRVRLEMTHSDFQYLTLLLGIACGALSHMGDDKLYGGLKFVNELNRTNPRFTPYELPEEATHARTGNQNPGN